LPDYVFVCPDCDHAEELTQSIHDDLPVRCPECDSDSYHQDYAGSLAADFCFVRGEPRTIGQIAEANNKRMGPELVAKKTEELKGPKKKKPWYRTSDKPLDVKNLNVEHYIRTGQKRPKGAA
jgi:putative FmdB family regulatory protein